MEPGLRFSRHHRIQRQKLYLHQEDAPGVDFVEAAAGIQSGSPEPHVKKVGKVNRAQLEEIATTKMPDLTAKDMDAAVRTIAGSARSGIEVEGVN